MRKAALLLRLQSKGPCSHREAQVTGDSGSLNPSASEFVPGLPMAEVERAARAAAGEMVARQEAERRQTRKEARRLSEAAKAAVARSKAATVKALSKERVKIGADDHAGLLCRQGR